MLPLCGCLKGRAMIYFQCDYAEGCHPRILERLTETNLEQTPGYGMDPHCERARNLIRLACGDENADVHFLVGGTQANTTVIASILRPHQGALCADTGHINCHETGAIEATGHKVLPLPNTDGTITGDQVRDYCRAHWDDSSHEHTVQPGLVYISYPTESGTLYTKQQLLDLRAACREWELPLFIDGARLGYGLTSPACDITLPELASLCDVFYIGGTKCGALFGEAVVITGAALKRDFRYAIKQHGGMLAKGRLLGIQFETLFEDGLYFEICKQAVDYALEIRRAFEARGIPMFGTSATNQQFAILTAEQQAAFAGQFASEYWGDAGDGRSIVRFCTSWATTRENVDALLKVINTL